MQKHSGKSSIDWKTAPHLSDPRYLLKCDALSCVGVVKTVQTSWRKNKELRPARLFPSMLLYGCYLRLEPILPVAAHCYILWRPSLASPFASQICGLLPLCMLWHLAAFPVVRRSNPGHFGLRQILSAVQPHITLLAEITRLLCTGPMRKSIKMAAREEMWTRNNGWVRGCYEQHLWELISLFTERFSQNEWLLEDFWASLFWTIPRCPMSEQECRIDHFRVTLVAKAFCPCASSLKFCQTSGKFSHVDEVLSFLSMHVAAQRVLWLLRALQDCGSSCRLAIDGMSCGRLQALFPFQRYALPGKRL